MEEIQVVEQRAVAILDQARALVVSNAQEYEQAGAFILSCKALASEIAAFFRPMKDAAHKAHRAICDKETNTLAPVNQAIKAASDAALPWKQAEDKRAREEAERQHREAVRQAQEAKLKEAQVLEAFGDNEAADKVLDEATYFEPRRSKVESTVPKVAGLSTQKKWKARIVQPSKVKRDYCLPDQTLVNYAVQRGLKFTTDPTPEQIRTLEEQIGGVEIFLEEGFVGRTAK